MEWLADNWLWILIGTGFVWLISRRGLGIRCCSQGHSHGSHKETAEHEGRAKTTPSEGACH